MVFVSFFVPKSFLLRNYYCLNLLEKYKYQDKKIEKLEVSDHFEL